MHRKELNRLAKVLDYVLSVRPDEFGLVPDSQGFVTVKELFQALREDGEWTNVGPGLLKELQHSREGERFEILEGRIRSKTGPIDVERVVEELPPARLFCGVRRRAHPVVLRHGLKPFKGPWVILARTREMAVRLGKRRDPEPVIMEVRVAEAARDGIAFYKTQGQLFLAESVPPEFLDGPPIRTEEVRTPPKLPRKAPEQMPGSFFLDFTGQREGDGKKRDRKSWKWQKDGKGKKRRK